MYASFTRSISHTSIIPTTVDEAHAPSHWETPQLSVHRFGRALQGNALV